MAEQRPFDPHAWLNEFRRFQADRAVQALEPDAQVPAIQAYIQRANAQSHAAPDVEEAGDDPGVAQEGRPRERMGGQEREAEPRSGVQHERGSLRDQVEALQGQCEQEQSQQHPDRTAGRSY